MENNKMNNYFNRFEWKKTVCRTIKELKKEFPLNNLIGKQIKSLNIIGSAEILYSWYLKRNEKTSESEKLIRQCDHCYSGEIRNMADGGN